MRVFLELLRIIFIFTIIGGLAGEVLNRIYTVNEVTKEYQWFGAIGIFIFLFVLYRNKLQFNGWYIGNGRKKLPRLVSATLLCSSLVLLVAPLAVGFLFR
jgi:hypothetical protein